MLRGRDLEEPENEHSVRQNRYVLDLVRPPDADPKRGCPAHCVRPVGARRTGPGEFGGVLRRGRSQSPEVAALPVAGRAHWTGRPGLPREADRGDLRGGSPASRPADGRSLRPVQAGRPRLLPGRAALRPHKGTVPAVGTGRDSPVSRTLPDHLCRGTQGE